MNLAAFQGVAGVACLTAAAFLAFGVAAGLSVLGAFLVLAAFFQSAGPKADA